MMKFNPVELQKSECVSKAEEARHMIPVIRESIKSLEREKARLQEYLEFYERVLIESEEWLSLSVEQLAGKSLLDFHTKINEFVEGITKSVKGEQEKNEILIHTTFKSDLITQFDQIRSLFKSLEGYRDKIKYIVANPHQFGKPFIVGSSELIEIMFRIEKREKPNEDRVYRERLQNSIPPILNAMLKTEELLKFRIKGSKRKIVPISWDWFEDSGRIKHEFKYIYDELEKTE